MSFPSRELVYEQQVLWSWRSARDVQGMFTAWTSPGILSAPLVLFSRRSR